MNSLRVKILGLVIGGAATSFETRDDKRREKKRKRFGFRLRHISQVLHVNLQALTRFLKALHMTKYGRCLSISGRYFLDTD